MRLASHASFASFTSLARVDNVAHTHAVVSRSVSSLVRARDCDGAINDVSV